MSGKIISTKLGQSELFESPVLMEGFLYQDISRKEMDEMMNAASCCLGKTPPPNTTSPGTLWVCSDCGRVWAIPYNQGTNWVLTRLKLADHTSRKMWNRAGYTNWISGITSFLISLVLSIVSVPAFSSLGGQGVVLSFGIFVIGWVVSGFFFARWRKYIKLYRFSVTE